MRRRMKASLIVIAIPFLFLLWIVFNNGINPLAILAFALFLGGAILVAWLPLWYIYRAAKSQAFLKSAPLLIHQAFIEEIEDENEDSYWDVFYADVSDHNDD